MRTTKAACEVVTVKALIPRLLTQSLGAAVLALITISCTSPVQPTIPIPVPQLGHGTPTTLELSGVPGVGPQGGLATISVRVVDAFKVPVPHVHVTLETSAGSLDPTALVTDGDGRGTAVLAAPAGSVALTASIANGPTMASLVAVQPSVQVPAMISLTMTATTVTVGTPTSFAITLQGGSIRSVAWEYGDGTRDEMGSVTATHIYAAAGSYNASALVTDTDGHATNLRNVVTVVPVPPRPPTPTPNPTPTPTPTPTPVFTRSGMGNMVFDLPTSVTRVRIVGTYAGSSSNFIVKIARSLIVNEIIGTGQPSTSSDGTFVTSGGTVEITNSAGVAWTFTEVR